MHEGFWDTLCYLINPQYATNFSSLPPYPPCRVLSWLPILHLSGQGALTQVAFFTWWGYDSLGHLHWDDRMPCLSKLNHSLVWTRPPPLLTFIVLLYALGPMAHPFPVLWCGCLLLWASSNKFRTELFGKNGRGKMEGKGRGLKKRNNLFLIFLQCIQRHKFPTQYYLSASHRF